MLFVPVYPPAEFGYDRLNKTKTQTLNTEYIIYLYFMHEGKREEYQVLLASQKIKPLKKKKKSERLL